jgi:hypothetical protein
MRLFFVLGLFLVQPLSAEAAVTPETLRDMAYAGDIDGAEAALAQAHAESLDGTITYDELREIVSILIVSHPDVIDFVGDWLRDYPNSPYAQTLYVFQMQDTAWRLRGNETASQTHPDAMQAFRDLQNRGMSLALEAYATAPDYVPASDAVFSHQLATKRLDWGMVNTIVDDVMTVTPSRGSLSRASLLTLPQWGGVGYRGVQGLCEHYAGQVTDVADGYTVDVCIIDLIHSASFGGAADAFANRRLGTLTHPNVLRARLRQIGEKWTPEGQQLILSFLPDAALNDRRFVVWLAHHLRYIDDVEAQMLAVDVRWQAEAEAGIIHDPYNANYIEVLLRNYRLPISQTLHFDDEKRAQRALLEQRLAAATLYDAGAWVAAGRTHLETARTSIERLGADPFFINAMYYGNHHQEYTEAMIMAKAGLFGLHQLLIEHGQPAELSDRQLEEDVLCPLARADRLYVAYCEASPDPRQPCGGLADVFPPYPMAMDFIITEGMCEAERNAAITDLFYTPVPVNLDDLHVGIANR